ncbi:CCR4-Not complex component, Not1-domain-containing protein [Bisporella sp. PMI_857]|nr:CCR4-Not complex component, Not1-domain-containing protein [Bisporella sp. PMI_857]
MVNSRAGTFTPSPAQQTIITGINHSPHGSHHSTFSAGASPSTNSPTGGSSSLVKIIIAQVYLLLGTIRPDDKDRTKWDQLQKLIDDNGMEVFQKYFSRLVVANASQIFPGHNRQQVNSNNYQLLRGEINKIGVDVEQAGKIAESIETANEELFRDFDLSTFMEHFKLDALEKTILALAFKVGSRPDLKTKADAILSANFTPFVQLLASNSPDHYAITSSFVATIIDRYIQEHPPNFDQTAKEDLIKAVDYRYEPSGGPPTEVLSALYLISILSQGNPLVTAIKAVGSAFTTDEDSCRRHIRSAGVALAPENVATALLYSAISRTHSLSPTILASAIQKEEARALDWRLVVAQFDQPHLRITKDQFLSLYLALRPLAENELLDIESLWGGVWHNSETQLSFISAFGSLSPDELDAATIPYLQPSFTVHDLEGADEETQEQAALAVRHPLVSLAAVSAMFHVALQSSGGSETVEAKRLFRDVVVPNLAIFVVSAFGVPKPWPDLAVDTLKNLFERFVCKYEPKFDLVLESCWRKDKVWVAQRLIETHAEKPLELQHILEHAVKHGWLDELVVMLNGFGLDLAALAHTKGFLNLDEWAVMNKPRRDDLAHSLLTFLSIKAQHEIGSQRSEQNALHSVMLPVKTVAALLNILEEILPKSPSQELIAVQRSCITAYPRLINYGEGFDDIINANGAESNSLPDSANKRMEEHYKQMYSEDLQVGAVVEQLRRYKHSLDPFDQDVFACMIHGLFDEYQLYSTYPLEALATTAVLFGGIISHKLISDLPLEIGLGMILEAVRDHSPNQPMHKFGLQALQQLLGRLPEWPGFCTQLLQVPGLQGTTAYKTAEEIVRENEESARLNVHNDANGGAIPNGNINEILAAEPSAPPFASINVEPPSNSNEDPSTDAQEKVQFVLNNTTSDNLESKFNELKDTIGEQHQQWFAEHLVEHRAKMQPNYHQLYLNIVKLFGRKSLWAEVLRETYVSVIRMLNSEATMQSASERTHLKTLGAWLGSITLARDKPIKYKNIAFKQLLLEAFDTQRLLVVIPFVCKVLVQGQSSTVFKPPNPWLMDIIYLLVELYHNAELKLNLKFEIEVLCKDLKLDLSTIVPSDEISSRAPLIEESTEPVAPEILDRFDNLSLNGLGGGATNGRFSPQEIVSSIPDLGPLLQYPPENTLVDAGRLREIVRSAITRAVQEIIAPVVERSVTIAAISTSQMIHKDFATEPDPNRVHDAAVNMVKKTAGSLALVTSKEPLRASMTNYIRQLAQNVLPQGLPEGNILMCVNSNLEIACRQVEEKAEERAVPEIEELIEPEMEHRRNWAHQRPDEAYMGPDLNRWSWTIPAPFKLQPNPSGLNQQQLNIYEQFARQPRQPSIGGSAHMPSTSDTNRSMANDILQDQYPSVPNLPTPAEPPAMPRINAQQPTYPQVNSSLINGRIGPLPNDPRMVHDQVLKILNMLEVVAKDAPEQHYTDLKPPHPLYDVLDALYQLIIKQAQGPEAFDIYIVDNICTVLFSNNAENLVIESLVHVLENACRIGGRTASRVAYLIGQQPGEAFLNVPLITALLKADMIEWRQVDSATSKALEQQREGSLEFFTSLLENVLLNDRPVALYADLAKSLEVAWKWIEEDPSLEVGQVLKRKLTSSGHPQDLSAEPDARLQSKQDQMEYVFQEWIHLYMNPNAADRTKLHFITQLYNKQVINNLDDLVLFLRLAIDVSVSHFEVPNGALNDSYVPIDSLAHLVTKLVVGREAPGEVKGDKAKFLKTMLAVCVLVLNHHHVSRGELYNQRVFVRLFSTMLIQINAAADELNDSERKDITLAFASTFEKLEPLYFPGFIFGWLSLVSHRDFLPAMMRIPDEAGWGPLANILQKLMSYLGDLLKATVLSDASDMIYRGTLKLMLALQHDYPDFLAAHHTQLLANIPSHCTYLHNMILGANPAKFSKMPDPLQPGLKVDRLPEIRESAQANTEVEATLRQSGLFDLLDQALQNGPGEDVVAALCNEIQIKRRRDTSFAFVPVNVDLKLIDAIVTYIGMHSIAKATQNGGPIFVQDSPAAELLSMLARELKPEARYRLLNSIVNQLRFPNSETHFYSQALLSIWGNDLNDPEETEVRQQITRILLERLFTNWPQPWGLTVVCGELIKNETYHFFESPFIKSQPEIGDRFVSFVQNMGS